ncbi:hypothetical protein QI30_16270 [Kurthia sp. 3B1D]|uniref:Transcriptional regulatory protein n=1 Tax=Candidatus Kurthia intestinigallinarum TaxID=1562256 RepID=A0A433RQP6_9BACL|nr:response regulator [Kurthia sp. 3B1D]RUS53102.1 hypothetical protein QI30_16270 [Kurthia sp. 3B1D]
MNIWIVEDDFRIANIHQEYIEQLERCKVTGSFRNGQEVKEALASKQVPHMLFLDLYIPDVEGYELVMHIRQRHPKVAIVMVTAAAEATHIHALKALGVYDYIVKPFNEERLQAPIQQLQKEQKMFATNEYFKQKQLDLLFLHTVVEEQATTSTKGIDTHTLDTIKELFIAKQLDKVTANELSEKMGISRSTARRYLEHLVAEKVLETALLYGTVGRPERKYMLRT